MRLRATRTTLLTVAERASVEIVCGEEDFRVEPWPTRAGSPPTPSLMPQPAETPTLDFGSKGPERPPSGNDGP